MSTELIYSTLASDAYWTVNKKLTVIFGLETSLYLSELISKAQYFKNKNDEEWFYLSSTKIEEQTTLSYHKQSKCLEKLQEYFLIETKRVGMPAKQYYKINYENIKILLETPCPLQFSKNRKHVLKEFKDLFLKNLKTVLSTVNSTEYLIITENNKKTTTGSGGFFQEQLITPKMFSKFWRHYPKKADKGSALTAWEKLCKKKERPSWKELRRAIHEQKKTERWQEKKYIPYPATWLNNNRWLDDPKEMILYKDDKKSGYTGKNKLEYQKPKVV